MQFQKQIHMKHLHLFIIVALLALTGCNGRFANPSMAGYEQSLSEADSLVQTGQADSALTAQLLINLHTRYTQICDSTQGYKVRIVSVEKSEYWWGWVKYGIFLLVIACIQVYIFYRLDNRSLRRRAIVLNDNEQDIFDAECQIADLRAYLTDPTLTDEARTEAEASLAVLEERIEKLNTDNTVIRGWLMLKQKHSMPRELELLQQQGERLRQQSAQVRTLTTNLVDGDELMVQLRQQPRFLTDDQWQHLRSLADRAYNDFTHRLADRFPTLTDADRQLCLLMRLRFTNMQIAALTAVSPASVSQQKFRLKKRLAQTDGEMFKNGGTLEMVVWSV